LTIATQHPTPTVRRVAVIGGSGGLGGATVQQLVAIGTPDIEKFQGHEQYAAQGVKEFAEVVVIDLAPPRFKHSKVTFKKCDVTRLDDVISALEGCSHVVHTAAIIDLRENTLQDIRSHNINVVGTVNVIQACIKLGIKVRAKYFPCNPGLHILTLTLTEFGLYQFRHFGHV